MMIRYSKWLSNPHSLDFVFDTAMTMNLLPLTVPSPDRGYAVFVDSVRLYRRTGLTEDQMAEDEANG